MNVHALVSIQEESNFFFVLINHADLLFQAHKLHLNKTYITLILERLLHQTCFHFNLKFDPLVQSRLHCNHFLQVK
jgi:hypothetical protein